MAAGKTARGVKTMAGFILEDLDGQLAEKSRALCGGDAIVICRRCRRESAAGYSVGLQYARIGGFGSSARSTLHVACCTLHVACCPRTGRVEDRVKRVRLGAVHPPDCQPRHRLLQ